MNLHLISMPFTTPYYTSIQIGCLKAYIDEQFKDKKNIKTFCHSAHFAIPLIAFRAEYNKIYDIFESDAELLWFLILIKKFNPTGIKNKKNKVDLFSKRLDKICKTTLTSKTIKDLTEATDYYIENELVPKLNKKQLNIIGFTLLHNQLYASIYCYFYLKEKYPKYNFLFVFGGGMAGFPRTLKAIKNLHVEGLVAIGEGELKLEKIIKESYQNNSLPSISEVCSSFDDIYNISTLTDQQIQNILPKETGQIKDLNKLPLPDYDEYFELIRKYSGDKEVYLEIKDDIILLIDGSRGCYHGKCDFCGLNISWCKYRSKSPERVYELVKEALNKYRIKRIHFSDNAGDVWMSRFCEYMIKDNLSVAFIPELRAQHDETFFTRMYLSGCKELLIGIESLSDSLLTKMKKGSTALDNIQTMKYLSELGISNSSNLITYHPKSDEKDIIETKDKISLITHLPKLYLMDFYLSEYSPLYNDREDKESLVPINKLSVDKNLFNILSDVMEIRHLLKDQMKLKWIEFEKWHKEIYKKTGNLTVTKIDKNKLLIKDTRYSRTNEYVLSGDEEKIYSLCHRMSSLDDIENNTQIKRERIQNILSRFVKDKLVICSTGRYLSLAIRPTQELVNNFYKGQTYNVKD